MPTGSAAGSAPAKEHGILPSLGASGAIYGCVSLCALAFPTAHVALAIPPSFPIPITWGVGGMVCLDILGILRGWRYVALHPYNIRRDNIENLCLCLGLLIIGHTLEALHMEWCITSMGPRIGVR